MDLRKLTEGGRGKGYWLTAFTCAARGVTSVRRLGREDHSAIVLCAIMMPPAPWPYAAQRTPLSHHNQVKPKTYLKPRLRNFQSAVSKARVTS